MWQKFKSVISKHMLWIKLTTISCEIALRWMPENTFVDFNIGSGNALESSSNKPLSEPILTKFHVASLGYNELISIGGNENV